MQYYADINYAPETDLLRQAIIKNENYLMDFLLLIFNIVQTLSEVQEHTRSFIKVVHLTMENIFQDHMHNQVHKVIAMQHAL